MTTDRLPRLDVADGVPDDPEVGLVDRSPLDIDDDALRHGIEAVLFLAEEPVGADALAEVLGVARTRIDALLAELGRHYAAPSGIELREAAGGWRLYTSHHARAVLERWVLSGRSGRLTQAALETLAVIAYKQPITRQAIGDVRGVNPDAAVRSLVARGFVEEVGREAGPGQAVLYGTTTAFLERLGLASLDDLPPLADFLADAPAPDEPEPGSLREVRRRLRAGGELDVALGGRSAAETNTGTLDDDEDDDGVLPPPTRREPVAVGAIGSLTDELDRAARSAASRLRSVVAAGRRDDAPDGSASGPESTTGTDGDDDA